ncbi:hypothetical protein ACLMJK_005552 [Lecanora helva]
MLPLSFNTPLYYAAADMLWIHGTNLGQARKVREDAWRAEFKEAMDILFPVSMGGDPRKLWTCFPGPTVFNKSEGEFPIHVVDAEGKEPVLIPGLDLLNHNPSSHVAWIWDLNACTIKTDEVVCGGCEVPNNYGSKSNEELIMGYGFSLPDNPADHFSIGFSPAVAANINLTRENRLRQKQRMQNDALKCLDLGKFEDIDIHWVRIRKNQLEFSARLLEDVSIAVENPRERKNADLDLRLNLELLKTPLSRNKLHVLCALIMIMQKAQTSISKFSPDLPKFPQNSRQADAARYRQTQLTIIDYALGTLISILSSLFQNRADCQEGARIARLEDILTDSPAKLKKDLRSVLNAGLKTRDPAKVRERGGTDFAMTVWLCGFMIYCRPYKDESEQALELESPFNRKCLLWLRLLIQEYPKESKDARFEKASGADLEDDKAKWLDPVRNSISLGDRFEETISTIASYMDAIKVCVDKHPQSLYNDPELDPKQLEWCYRVVRHEGVWIPNLFNSEGDDEWVLLLQD